MKNSIIKYGGYGALLGGIIFIGSHYLPWNIGFYAMEVFGWISIFASLSFVFFGIKHYRDKLNDGLISFRKALLIGLAISVIAGLTIGILDIVYLLFINPDFPSEYVQHTLDGLKETVSVEEFEIQKVKLLEDMKAFDNPAFGGIFMFSLVLGVGVLISLISSLVLSKKPS